MTVNDFLLDFAIASLFIMVGQLIRAKVGLVQKFFVPASMIAGFIALALGNQGLNVLPFSGSIGDYPGALIILIFAAVGMNGFSFSKKEFKSELDRVGSYFSYKVLAQAIQFAFAPPVRGAGDLPAVPGDQLRLRIPAGLRLLRRPRHRRRGGL